MAAEAPSAKAPGPRPTATTPPPIAPLPSFKLLPLLAMRWGPEGVVALWLGPPADATAAAIAAARLCSPPIMPWCCVLRSTVAMAAATRERSSLMRAPG